MVNTDRLCMGCMNDNGGEKICPICGYDVSQDNGFAYLPVGTWLSSNRYLIGRVIEESGDGVTYIAWDNENNMVVNVKEFFPAGIALRSANRLTVTPSENRGLEFTRGKEEFVSLFESLANMPASTAILKVVDGFETGGTAYAVFSTVSGTTLKAFLIRHGGALKWEQVKTLFMPLIETVAELNEAGIIHRGISPDNIIVGRDGKLRLSGFCVRGARVQHSEYLSQLSTGYAAPEQYLENESSSSPCDVYALGAILFRCLIGTTPPDAKDRLINDKLSIPAKVADTVPRKLLVIIANALKVDKAERIQNSNLLRSNLESVPLTTVVAENDDAEKEDENRKNTSGIKYVVISILVTALIFIVGIVAAYFIFDLGSVFAPDSKPTGGSSVPSSSEESSSNQGYAPGTVLFEVPNLIGKPYSEIYGDLQTEYAHFEFEVAGRVASDEVPKGSICQQSVEGGTKAERKTLIKIYISQGPDKVSMPIIMGLSVDEAKSRLFDAGFYSDTIIVRKGFDLNAESGAVYRVTYGEDDTDIAAGTKISVNQLIVIYYRDPDTVTTPDTPTDDTTTDIVTE